jgi:glycosyltransferase involved in cell wall biosynthesis
MEKLISVVIPIHDPLGIQIHFLEDAFQSLLIQNLKPYEILVASSHKLNYQKVILEEYRKYLPISIVRNFSQGAGENLNLLISKSSAKYVKILFQDDLLSGLNYLENCVELLDSHPQSWGLVTVSRNFGSDIAVGTKVNIPRFSIRMLEGINLFGSPSSIMFRRNRFLPFNEGLRYLFDCEWYTRMIHNWGMPLLSNTISTRIRIHDYQETNNVKHLLKNEKAKSQKLHDASTLSHIKLKYLGSKIKCKCQIN